jgi:hypothetical protein
LFCWRLAGGTGCMRHWRSQQANLPCAAFTTNDVFTAIGEISQPDS